MNKRLTASVLGIFGFAASAADATTTSCSTVAACIFGSNTSSGIGVEGSSKSGFGISGVSSSGHGVNGTSSSSFGIVGMTKANATSTGTARAGVLGQDASTNKSAYNSGVAGTSKYGYGVSGSGNVGVYGSGASGVVGLGSTYGGYFESSGSGTGVTIYALGDGPALFAYATGSGNAEYLETESASADLINGSNHVEQVVSIDGAGNEILRGSLTMDGIPKSRTHSSQGPDVASFGAQTAAPSIEDVGKAQLRNGAAYVALDRTFSSTIDPQVPYSVFVTPEGDSNGLYTAQLSAAGFAVHENKGGRSSLVFDYRIVAKPFGSKAMHLPMMRQFRQLADHNIAPKRP